MRIEIKRVLIHQQDGCPKKLVEIALCNRKRGCQPNGIDLFCSRTEIII